MRLYVGILRCDANAVNEAEPAEMTELLYPFVLNVDQEIHEASASPTSDYFAHRLATAFEVADTKLYERPNVATVARKCLQILTWLYINSGLVLI